MLSCLGSGEKLSQLRCPGDPAVTAGSGKAVPVYISNRARHLFSQLFWVCWFPCFPGCLPHGVGGTKHSTTGSSSGATFFKVNNLHTLNTQSVIFKVDLFIDRCSAFLCALITLTLLLWSVFRVFCVQWDWRACVSVAAINASPHLFFFILWGYYPG